MTDRFKIHCSYTNIAGMMVRRTFLVFSKCSSGIVLSLYCINVLYSNIFLRYLLHGLDDIVESLIMQREISVLFNFLKTSFSNIIFMVIIIYIFLLYLEFESINNETWYNIHD